MAKKTMILALLVVYSAAVLYSQDNDVISVRVETRTSDRQNPDAPFFYILNATGFMIEKVFVSRADSGDSNWGESVFNERFYDGRRIVVTLNRPLSEVSHYKIRLVDGGGDHYSKYNVKIEDAVSIKISIADLDFNE